MFQFTLSQLLMATALCAILLGFVGAEGCGERYTMIESISFSSDGSRIAVAKLAARDAQTPFKGYKANVSRTVSWLDASTGDRQGIVHQDFKGGNCGPAFGLWRAARTSVLCNPSSDQIAASAFGGGDVTLNLGAENPEVAKTGHWACNIEFSKSGRYLAASGADAVTVLDTQDGTIAMQGQARDDLFLRASKMSFTHDDRSLIVANESDVRVWDISALDSISIAIQGRDKEIEDIAVAPDDTLIVCSDSWVRRYDLAGELIATLAESGAYQCQVSAAGNQLVVDDYDSLAFFNLDTNRESRRLPIRGVTAMAFSPDGDALAVGDRYGQVTLIDTATGSRRWRSNPPSRYRHPWTVPAAFVVAWALVVRRLSKRQ